MASRYIITVNRDAIDKGSETPIRVQDTTTGKTSEWRTVLLRGSSIITYGPEREDGATVWIESDDYEVLE